MKEKSTEEVAPSSPTWETLEAFARQSIQQLPQRMLEEEVDGLLGRHRYERRDAVDAPAGYRNGFGKPRRLSLSDGTIMLRRPRVRGLSERFESRLLPAFKRRTEEVGRLLPELYLHGLAHGDFDLALRGLLGDGAPLSAPSIARLKAGWQADYELWKTRSVADLEVVYLWVDGVYVKAGLEKDKAAILVALAALRDGRKGDPRRRERLSGIDRELGGDLGGPQTARAVGAEAGDRRWACRDLGGAGRGVPRGEGAAVLEPSPPERPRQAASEAASRSAPSPHHDPVRRDPRGGRAAEAGVPGLVHHARPRRGRPRTRPGLEPAGDVLPVPTRALEAPAHEEPGRVALRRGAAADAGGTLPRVVRGMAGALADRSLRGCSPHDRIDAFAALWTARRILSAEAVTIPPRPARDSFGLAMEIVA